MDQQPSLDVLEKIRQQYENSPYPRFPLEKTPKDDPTLDSFFIHNLVTSSYLRNQRVKPTEGTVILDAGCGSGYKCLMLAESNPGAHIVGIDISPESVSLARQRLDYHGFSNCEFHTLGIEELSQLGLAFDYINCDEVLYLLPNPTQGLQAMKSVLKPEGIIRANLHSILQRRDYYRAQNIFGMMGLMDEPPSEFTVELVIEVMKALKDQTDLKKRVWQKSFEDAEESAETIIVNHLLQGDKGFTITDLFDLLRATDLELVSMVNWRDWELSELFKNPEDLPMFLAMSLPELSPEEQLRLYELLNPVHRLLDFWCGHPDQANPAAPLSTWTANDWLTAQVQLHPQLKASKVRESLLEAIAQRKPFEISNYLRHPTRTPILVDGTIATCLLPLWDGPQPISVLVDRWLKVRPLDPISLEPVSAAAAFQQIQEMVQRLELFLYLLVERQE